MALYRDENTLSLLFFVALLDNIHHEKLSRAVIYYEILRTRHVAFYRVTIGSVIFVDLVGYLENVFLI